MRLGKRLRKLAAKVKELAWDESKYQRGKTTPGSRGGSFAPKKEHQPAGVGAELSVLLVRKPRDLFELAGENILTHSRVTKQKVLSSIDYDQFVRSPLDSHDWLKDFPIGSSAGRRHVLEMTAPGRRPLYIDTQGYDYARYVGYRNDKGSPKTKSLSIGLKSVASGLRELALINRRALPRGANRETMDGVWRTVRGRRVFIKKGESLDTALARSDIGRHVSGAEKIEKATSKKHPITLPLDAKLERWLGMLRKNTPKAGKNSKQLTPSDEEKKQLSGALASGGMGNKGA